MLIEFCRNFPSRGGCITHLSVIVCTSYCADCVMLHSWGTMNRVLFSNPDSGKEIHWFCFVHLHINFWENVKSDNQYRYQNHSKDTEYIPPLETGAQFGFFTFAGGNSGDLPHPHHFGPRTKKSIDTPSSNDEDILRKYTCRALAGFQG